MIGVQMVHFEVYGNPIVTGGQVVVIFYRKRDLDLGTVTAQGQLGRSARDRLQTARGGRERVPLPSKSTSRPTSPTV